MRWEFIIKLSIEINGQSNKNISKASRKRVIQEIRAYDVWSKYEVIFKTLWDCWVHLMNKNVGKAQISQKWSNSHKKEAIKKTLIRNVTRANPLLPHDS